MSRDSVRYGRVPKRSREKGMEEALNEAGPVAVAGAASVVEDSSDIVSAVASAHRAYCAFTEELTRGLQRRPLPPPSPTNPSPSPPVDPSPPTASALTPVDSQRIWLWQQLAVRATPSVQRVVEFAKRVPGFPDLSQDDQLILIKMGFFEIWLCHAARFATESMLTFDDGVYVTHNQLEVMYDVQFAASVLGFMTNLNITCLNETEIGLFAAAVLVTPDRPGVTDVKAVQFHQERIVEALKFQISRRHPGAEGLSVEALLGELRAVGTHHLHLLDWFRANWTSLRLPPLFAEIFDIPKCDEDLQ